MLEAFVPLELDSGAQNLSFFCYTFPKVSIKMEEGIRQALKDLTNEMKGIKSILSAMWQKRYAEGQTEALLPGMTTDEFISSEEAGRRLGVSDQTLRNWIAIGKRDSSKGWVEGLHYCNVSPDPGRRAIIRIPWNQLVQSFAKNAAIQPIDTQKSRQPLYSPHKNKEE